MYLLWKSTDGALDFSFSHAWLDASRVAYDIKLITGHVKFIIDNNLTIEEFREKYPRRYASLYHCCSGHIYYNISPSRPY